MQPNLVRGFGRALYSIKSHKPLRGTVSLLVVRILQAVERVSSTAGLMLLPRLQSFGVRTRYEWGSYGIVVCVGLCGGNRNLCCRRWRGECQILACAWPFCFAPYRTLPHRTSPPEISIEKYWFTLRDAWSQVVHEYRASREFLTSVDCWVKA